MQNKESLQDKFYNFGAQPSENLWSAIASKMDAKKRKKRIVLWWTFVGVVATIGVFLMVRTNKNISPVAIERVEKTKLTNIKKKQTEQKIAKTSTDFELIESNTKENTKQKEKKGQLVHSEQNVKQKSHKTAKNFVAPFNKVPAKQKTNTTEPSFGKNNSIILCQDCDLKLMHAPLLILKVNRKTNNNNLLPLNSSKNKRKFIYSFNIMSLMSLTKTSEENNLFVQFYDNLNTVSPASENSISDLKTNIPLLFRFGVATPISKRFKVYTGIDLGWILTRPISIEPTYSKLSQFTIGIPLLVGLKIINKRRFDFNFNVGIVNDFVALKQNKSYLNSTLKGTESSFTQGFLGGTETGFRFNFKLNEQLKIGLGTGLRWYYYHSKSLLLSDKPSVFYTVNTGLIWNY
ncbi:MAG TPA: hypothetical protein EYG85_10780 [Crocinitomix sp.]|nr:hypothetical protein [Crocinitomix sp.]